MTATPRRAGLAAALTVAALTMATGCTSTSTSSSTSAQAANNALAGTTFTKFSSAVPYPYQAEMPSDPLERKNLARRLEQYNSKGSTNYVYLFTYSGQVIGYYVITGKVSSTGSEMTSTQVNVHCGYNGTNMTCTNDAIGDDGSYGPAEGGPNGVFFWTVSGTLVETNQPWVVSSQPIKLYASAPQLDAPAKK